MFPLMPNGHLALLSAEELARIPRHALRVWCHQNARYTLVTRELVQWLHELIAGRSAIEVGAGQGDLGYHLGIPMSDSGSQTEPLVRFSVMLHGSMPTNPPPDVERLTAEAALAKYKPQVIIASWLTQFVGSEESAEYVEGSLYGTREELLIEGTETYVHIGNRITHAQKRILKIPHQEYHYPWLISRSEKQEHNRIWVWERKP